MPDTEKLVTLTRLQALLESYGATPEYWPEEERAAATALIETSSEARMLVEEAIALDALLDKIPEPEVSAALTSRVRSMALPAGETKTTGFISRLASFLRPQTPRGWQGAVAMAGVLGMVGGMGVSQLTLTVPVQAPQIVTVAAPTSASAPVIAQPSDLDTGQSTTASLSPNLVTYSLTGEDTAEGDNDLSGETSADADQQANEEEFTIASVPLY